MNKLAFVRFELLQFDSGRSVSTSCDNLAQIKVNCC
ncbi:hypothetical protein Marpi_0285 [Marinitoga piezophila KA3]|uniref:Uncharacterized protein n=1 Tax=Marinitoga piezophila (strain DSM 14283 / JCM 11233 / KA3) TaxID=443254 RepID=H2J408_MARPK|nr:hypothetical protein Marpi_0285 [Marinitoga piezophila KA3]